MLTIALVFALFVLLALLAAAIQKYQMAKAELEANEIELIRVNARLYEAEHTLQKLKRSYP